MMKKVFFLCLCVCLMMCAGALAAPLTIENNIVVAFDGSVEEVQIPDGVVGIGDYAFSGYDNLRSVTMPSSLTDIGYCAFANCQMLETVTFPQTITTIGASAFYHCPMLTDLKLPDSVTVIEPEAFAYCTGLKEVQLPKGLTALEDSAFAHCTNLEMVYTSASLSTIAKNAFSKNPMLVFVTGGNQVVEDYCTQNDFFPVEKKSDFKGVGPETYLSKAPNGWLWIQEARASSYIKSTRNGNFRPYSAIDVNDDTSWQFEISSKNDLRDIYIDLILTVPSAVNGVPIKQGFRTGDQYVRNGRPTRVEISFQYQGSNRFADPVEINIPDNTNDDNYHDLMFEWRLDVVAVRVRMVSVAVGSKFTNDVAVSEIRVNGLPMSEIPSMYLGNTK